MLETWHEPTLNFSLTHSLQLGLPFFQFGFTLAFTGGDSESAIAVSVSVVRNVGMGDKIGGRRVV